MNLSKATKRAILSIVAMLVLVAGILQSSGTASAAGVVEKTISCAGGSVTFSYTTQASITNLSSKPAWLSVSSKLNSATSVTYTITASANSNCGSRSFDLYFSGTGETYRIIQYGMGHSTASRTVNPTYTAAGYTESYCQRCGTVFSRTTIDKLKCKVIFDPCNGESTTYKMLETQKAIGNLPVKSGTWTGHTFLGWYTAKSGGTQVTANTTVPAQATYTIYGQWRTNTYTVSFDANGGSGAPASQIKTYNVTLKLSSTKPTRTGYDFVGWGYSKTDTKASFSAGGNYTTNVAIQLYAIWTPAKYTVTFDSQGGSSVASRTVTYNGTYGTSSNQLTNPTRSGYVFDGWYTAKSGGTKVAYTTKVTTASNHTLYAHWTAVYTIKFDPNGGSGAPGNQTKKNGTDLIIPATVPQRTGYTFKGWGTSSTATKVSYAPGDKYKTNAAATLYAVWEPLTFKVYFKDGDKTLTTGTVTYGKTYGTLSKATKTGYYDAKWYTEKTGGKEVTSSTKVTITANQTLYARWIPREYTVTFDSQGGSSVASRTVTFDSTYGTSKNQLPNPTLSGYTFDGWYTAKTGGTKISYTSTVTTASNHTLYAHWKVEVTFNVNGGTGSATKKTFFKGTTYGSLPKGPTAPAGFRFIGWFTSLIGGKQITENTSVGADANAYARYAIDVNFSANGGTGSITGVTYYRGDTYGKLPDAPKAPAGYEFDGWYNMASGGAKISTNTKVTEAYKTLYAHWKAKDIEVTLDYYVGYTETKKFKYNGKYSDLPTPTRSGYTFLGWYIGENGGTKVTTSTTVTTDRDHKLFAHWINDGTWLKTEGGSYKVTVDFFAPNHKWNCYVIANRDTTQEGTVPDWVLNDPKPATNTSKSLEFSYSASTNGEGRTLLIYAYEIGTARAMVYKFAQKAGYSVTYNPVGNLPAKYLSTTLKRIDPSVKEKGKNLALPSLVNAGFAFKGWKEKGGDIIYKSEYTLDKGASLEAVWEAYTISFNENGGEWKTGTSPNPCPWYENPQVISTQPVSAANRENGVLVLPSDVNYIPTRGAYTFFGWNTKEDGSGEFFFPNSNMESFGRKLTKNVELFAIWKPYTVTFNENWGKWTNGSKPNPVVGTKKITIPNYDELLQPIDGFYFYGWNTKTDGTGEFFFPNDQVELTKDLSLFAIWYPIISSADEGYTYTFTGEIKPGEECRVLIDMPDKYCGFYKLVVGQKSDKELSYQIDGAKGKTFLVPKSEHPASEYYYIASEMEEVFLVIKNPTKNVQKADVQIVSNKYEISQEEIDSNTTVVWKSAASSYFPATWEVYLCPRDVGAYLTAYNIAAGVYLDKQNLKEFLKEHTDDILLDVTKEAVKFALGKYVGDKVSDVTDYVDTVGGLVTKYIGKYHEYMTSQQTAYWWLTGGVFGFDNSMDNNRVGKYADIFETQIPYNLEKAEYGVRFTIQPNIVGGDADSVFITSSMMVSNEKRTNIWNGEGIKIRPGAIGSFEIYNYETPYVLENTHLLSEPWSNVSWITAANSLNQCQAVLPTNGKYYIMDKIECDK